LQRRTRHASYRVAFLSVALVLAPHIVPDPLFHFEDGVVVGMQRSAAAPFEMVIVDL
jgi:hypothetical protein